MEARERVYLHDCCIVPYRYTAAGVEFCLVTPAAENRWAFPKTTSAAEQRDNAVLGEIAAASGLQGHLEASEPLGFFEASRGNEARSMTGYLMRVEHIDDDWPQRSAYRRMWCLAEEARVRIRRKPLRRFIDSALHWIEARGRAATNGHRVNGNGVHA